MSMNKESVIFKSYFKQMQRDIEGLVRDWQRWCIFVDVEDVVLDKIAYVEYHLPPTFPNPDRLINDRHSKFALGFYSSQSFQIRMTVRFVDGNEHEYTHSLHESTKGRPDRLLPWPCPQSVIG